MNTPLTLLTFCLLAGSAAQAQHRKNRDTIPYTDPAKWVDDFSNRSERRTNTLYNEALYQQKNTLVIINQKLYSIGAKEFTTLSKDSIAELRIIHDEQTAAPVKTVIWIRTR